MDDTTHDTPMAITLGPQHFISSPRILFLLRRSRTSEEEAEFIGQKRDFWTRAFFDSCLVLSSGLTVQSFIPVSFSFAWIVWESQISYLQDHLCREYIPGVQPDRKIGRVRHIRGLPCLRLTALILVVEYHNHGGMNQKVRYHHPRYSNWCPWYQIKYQWKLEREYDEWTLKGLETGLYIGVEDRSTSNGAKVVAVKDKSIWHIQQDEKSNQHFRYLSLPNSVSLSNHVSLGSSPRMSRRTSIYQIMEKDQTLKFGASTSCGSLMKAS